jgi:hypothetical protein
LLLEFSATGGAVIQVGSFPDLVDATPDERLTQLRSAVRTVDRQSGIRSVLAATLPPAVEVEGQPGLLWIHRRRVGAQQLLFLVNLSRRDGIIAKLRWRDVGGLTTERLDPTDGSRAPQACESSGADSLLALMLAPGESRLFLASPGAGSVYQGASVCSTAQAPATPHPLALTRVERLDDNALLLDTARYRLGDRPWSARPVPVMAIQEYLNGSRYAGPLTLRFEIESRLTGRRKAYLIVEHPDVWRIALNGQPVAYGGLPFWRDMRWLPIDIGDRMVRGLNEIECHIAQFRHGDLCCFGDQAGRYGTELESLMLVGDFGVEGRPGDETPVCPLWEQYRLRPPRSRCLTGPFVLVDPRTLGLGDVTSQGLPFYAGRLRYEYAGGTGIPGATLRLAGLEASVAQVTIDGKSIGGIAWAPYTLCLGDVAGEGTTMLTITLHNSLRNLLGPHHHPQGLMPVDYPGAYTADPHRVRNPNGSNQAWLFAMERGETHSAWNPHYVFRQYGLLEPAWLSDCSPVPATQ